VWAFWALVDGVIRPLPSLRTDSVNRGFFISFLTLATVVLRGVIEVFPFFFIPGC
jgi:hypothetical protein